MELKIGVWIRDRWLRGLRDAGIIPSIYGGELRLLRMSEGSTRPHEEPQRDAHSVPTAIPARDSGGRNDLLVLEGDFRRPDLRHPRPWRLDVNRNTHSLDWRRTSAWLVGDERPDDAWLARVPTAFERFLAPISQATEAYYRRQEAASGLSRHGYAVLKALHGRVDPAVHAMLGKAFTQARKDELITRERRITFADAVALLQDYNQTVRTVPTNPPIRAFSWWREGFRPVARGYEGAPGEAPVVRVYGRVFNGRSAKALTMTFAQRLTAADEDTARHRPVARSRS